MNSDYRAVDIARSFLPQRVHYWYSRCKLATDPLYRGVAAAFAGTTEPLLDLGCGIGLLVHTLRRAGFTAPYRGVDNDAAKIVSASAAAQRALLARVTFETVDLATYPSCAHSGSVALLDVMQFMPVPAAQALLVAATECVSPTGRLVIRTGIERSGARMGFTRAVDRASRRIGWMNAAPHWYPTRAALERMLGEHGLRASFAPLTGLLPFDNWIVVAERS